MTNDTDPVGRQPGTAYIAPSKRMPWYGQIIGGEVVHGFRKGGIRFTREQLRALGDDETAVAKIEAIEVRRHATTREAWWPSRTEPPIFAFDCPVIRRYDDGQIDVISPSGMVKRVQADGWISPPGGSKWRTG